MKMMIQRTEKNTLNPKWQQILSIFKKVTKDITYFSIFPLIQLVFMEYQVPSSLLE